MAGRWGESEGGEYPALLYYTPGVKVSAYDVTAQPLAERSAANACSSDARPSIPNERLRAAIYAYTYTHLCLHTCMRMSTSVHTCWDEWSEYLGPPLCAFSLDDLEI